MDRNTFTGLFLIMIVLAGSFYFFKPSEVEIKKEKERIAADSVKSTSTAATTAPVAPITTPTIDSATLKGPFGNSLTGTEAVSVLENESLKISFSNKGGKIVSVQVKGQETYDGKPVILLDANQTKFGLNLNIGGKIVSTNDLFFVATKTGNALSMKASYLGDKFIEFNYDLKQTTAMLQ